MSIQTLFTILGVAVALFFGIVTLAVMIALSDRIPAVGRVTNTILAISAAYCAPFSSVVRRWSRGQRNVDTGESEVPCGSGKPPRRSGVLSIQVVRLTAGTDTELGLGSIIRIPQGDQPGGHPGLLHGPRLANTMADTGSLLNHHDAVGQQPSEPHLSLPLMPSAALLSRSTTM